MKLTIGHLYPDLLNLYGDRGNIQCLKMRLVWRGFDVEVRRFCIDDRVDFSDLDIVLLGGGSDREQMIVCRKLQQIQKDFRDYVEDGGTTIAVCGGYQLLGHYYNTPDGKMEGLHLADLYTEQGSPRLISNIVLKNDRYPYPVVGFENHGGRTHLGEGVEPFGKVVFGYGNNGMDHEEGVIYRNVIGTYLHGPLLPKNPHVCDDLLLRALRRRGYEGTLQPLDDHEEREANAYIVRRFAGSSDS
ncbi:MAG TPA: glutamine amidotransferase [Lachnospiraceae bacterium]|nr:glutamine amidotransferase [Lachnospiraceae bacterium]